MDPVLPDVRYKIQNVDYATFLERRGKSQLILRAEKKGNLRQQWYFSKIPNSKMYKIENADDRAYTISSTDSVLIASKQDTQNYWRLAPVAGRPTFYLVNFSRGVGDENVLLNAVKGDVASVSMDSNIDDADRIMKNEEFRWKIIEVAPASLPDGDGQYRVRTLNGDAIHSATQGSRKVISIQNQSAGPQRAWEIKSQGNGNCSIKSIAEQGYLCAEKVGGRWTPGISKTLGTYTTWKVKSISDFAYSFCINLPLDPSAPNDLKPMSLSVDQKTIILKPMKAAHNQLWCIEAEDAPLGSTFGGAETDDTGPEGSGKFHGVEYGKDYLLRYGDGKLFLALNMDNDSASSGVKDDASVINVEKNPQARNDKDHQGVYLSTSLDGKKKYLVLNSGTLKLDRTSPYPWIIEENPDETGNFYICDGKQSANVLRGKGMVGDQITSSSGSKSDKNSFWQFEPSD